MVAVEVAPISLGTDVTGRLQADDPDGVDIFISILASICALDFPIAAFVLIVAAIKLGFYQFRLPLCPVSP